MASWRATKENEQCTCCAKKNYIPTNYKIYDNRIIINEIENLCCDCDEFWCTPGGQTLLKERLQIHEGQTCNLCEKKVNEELRGLGPILHNDCIKAIDDYQHGRPITTRIPLSQKEIEKIKNLKNLKVYKSKETKRPIQNTQYKKNFNSSKNKWKPGNTKWSWIKTT